ALVCVEKSEVASLGLDVHSLGQPRVGRAAIAAEALPADPHETRLDRFAGLSGFLVGERAQRQVGVRVQADIGAAASAQVDVWPVAVFATVVDFRIADQADALAAVRAGRGRLDAVPPSGKRSTRDMR